MKYLRYSGEFVSVRGIIWRIDILQDSQTPFSNIGDLEFDADLPLSIEWGERSKDQVICGSVATLHVISPGDRTFEDLYSIEAGRVQLNVYRNDSLYWSGTIDTEFYEEPYEQAYGYTVDLTFSDFGILNRLKFNQSGMRSAYELLHDSIQRCGLTFGGIDQSLISTSLDPAGSGLTLLDISLRSDNFYDEDGEPAALSEVLEGILRPLGLRMVQKAGKIYVYDLNGLYTGGQEAEIEWDGDHQTLGADVVYNNVRITWSPYAESSEMKIDKCFTGQTPADLTALNNLEGKTRAGLQYFSYHYGTDFESYCDATDSGFTLWTGSEGTGAELMDPAAKFFRIVPQNDGSEQEGIALHWKSVQFYWQGSPTGGRRQMIRTSTFGCNPVFDLNRQNAGAPLFKTGEMNLPPVSAPEKLNLFISAEMLLDPRFNPYEEAVNWETHKQKDLFNQWKDQANFVYAPVTIKFQPYGSRDIYCWDNRNVVLNDADKVTTVDQTFGQWVIYDMANDSAPTTYGLLAWYNSDDRAHDSGALGWKHNRPAMNPHIYPISTGLAKSNTGQYIPYPSMGGNGGKLWVEVRQAGWRIWPAMTTQAGMPEESYNELLELWASKNFLLMTVPDIKIVNASQFDREIKSDDVEYNGELNPYAKESLDIDTICGTCAEGIPTARGAYFNTASHKQITEFTRAGRTSQAEILLAGTLYSQYATRHTVLKGESVLLSDPLAVYTEANQGDKKFMVLSDVQDMRMDTSDAKYVELSPDEYDKDNN